MSTGDIPFSDADRAIVRELRVNGRATNQQIAEKLGLTATTVSSRIRRMEELNQLRVVAVADFAALGLDMLLRVAVHVAGRPASAVAEEMAKIPEVFAAHLVTGRHDIDLLLALQDFRALNYLLEEELGKIEGVTKLTPTIVLDVIKYKFDVAPIHGGKQ